MAKVEIYTSPFCGFCYHAKELLADKGIDFDEIDVTFHPRRRSEMLDRANGQRTVPQIFVDDKHVGGCNDLYTLESRGELDPILG